jgi:AraC-like DNA-binding protein
MLRLIDHLEGTERDVIALETVYSDDGVVAAHAHQRVQLLYAAIGIMQLETKFGAWIVPPGFAVWIPAGVTHRVRTINATTHSLYFKKASLDHPPLICRVIEVSSFLKEVIREAVKAPLLYEPDSRDDLLMKMLLQEASIQPEVSLHLPMPSEMQLAKLCHAFFKSPTLASTPAAWAAQLHISERTFYRRFLASTGMTFANWRQQACVLVAMSQLSLGQSVTRIALDMGYESPSSFSTMFKKSMGVPPSAYIRSHRRAVGL